MLTRNDVGVPPCPLASEVLTPWYFAAGRVRVLFTAPEFDQWSTHSTTAHVSETQLTLLQMASTALQHQSCTSCLQEQMLSTNTSWRSVHKHITLTANDNMHKLRLHAQGRHQ
jgi:hypothetical protein